ncbi:MAG: nucleotidyltransferase family protein [Gammaproteobacteria bacterium]|nr:nucleotidyltransferase family protein [Gammaproteobacteria bacterium]
MILAAGKGTRLFPLTETVPKPMILINSEPLIVHQIRWLKRAGVQDIVVNIHHLADQIETCLGSGRHLGVRITLSRETKLLETGGGIAKALKFLGKEPFIVLNGDIWTNFQFRLLAQATTEYAHLVLRHIDAEGGRDFALNNGLVSRSKDPVDHTHTFCGISVLHPRIFEETSSESFSLTRDLLFRLTNEGKVTGELFDGAWVDIGSPQGLKRVRSLTA